VADAMTEACCRSPTMPLAGRGSDAPSGHGDTCSLDLKADFLLACGA